MILFIILIATIIVTVLICPGQTIAWPNWGAVLAQRRYSSRLVPSGLHVARGTYSKFVHYRVFKITVTHFNTILSIHSVASSNPVVMLTLVYSLTHMYRRFFHPCSRIVACASHIALACSKTLLSFHSNSMIWKWICFSSIETKRRVWRRIRTCWCSCVWIWVDWMYAKCISSQAIIGMAARRRAQGWWERMRRDVIHRLYHMLPLIYLSFFPTIQMNTLCCSKKFRYDFAPFELCWADFHGIHAQVM